MYDYMNDYMNDHMNDYKNDYMNDYKLAAHPAHTHTLRMTHTKKPPVSWWCGRKRMQRCSGSCALAGVENIDCDSLMHTFLASSQVEKYAVCTAERGRDEKGSRWEPGCSMLALGLTRTSLALAACTRGAV